MGIWTSPRAVFFLKVNLDSGETAKFLEGSLSLFSFELRATESSTLEDPSKGVFSRDGKAPILGFPNNEVVTILWCTKLILQGI